MFVGSGHRAVFGGCSRRALRLVRSLQKDPAMGPTRIPTKMDALQASRVELLTSAGVPVHPVVSQQPHSDFSRRLASYGVHGELSPSIDARAPTLRTILVPESQLRRCHPCVVVIEMHRGVRGIYN